MVRLHVPRDVRIAAWLSGCIPLGSVTITITVSPQVTWSGCPCRATWGFSGSVPMHYCDYHEAAGSFLL